MLPPRRSLRLLSRRNASPPPSTPPPTPSPAPARRTPFLPAINTHRTRTPMRSCLRSTRSNLADSTTQAPRPASSTQETRRTVTWSSEIQTTEIPRRGKSYPTPPTTEDHTGQHNARKLRYLFFYTVRKEAESFRNLLIRHGISIGMSMDNSVNHNSHSEEETEESENNDDKEQRDRSEEEGEADKEVDDEEEERVDNEEQEADENKEEEEADDINDGDYNPPNDDKDDEEIDLAIIFKRMMKLSTSKNANDRAQAERIALHYLLPYGELPFHCRVRAHIMLALGDLPSADRAYYASRATALMDLAGNLGTAAPKGVAKHLAALKGYVEEMEVLLAAREDAEE